MKFLFLLSLLILFPKPNLTAGETGADFLNFKSASRPSSMAGAFTAMGDDVNTLRYNPAGAGRAKYNHAALMHNEAGEGITHQHVSFMKPVGLLDGGAGLSISYFRVGGITGYTGGGEEKEKDIRSESLSFTGSFGAPLSDSLYGGISAKLISQYLYEYSAHAIAFDGGVLWTPTIDGVSFGASVTNFGGRLKFIGESSPLPLEFRVGSAYIFSFMGTDFITSVDGVFPYHYSPRVNLGTELSFLDFAFIRAGYSTCDDLGNGLQLGGGIKTSGLSFDYAWSPRGDFDNSHKISLGLRFGRKYGEMKIEQDIRNHFERGETLYNAGRLLEAYREFTLITTLTPRHRQASEYLNRIELRIEDAQVAGLIEENLQAGQEYYNQGQLARAIEKFETVLSLQEDNEKAVEYLKMIRSRFEEAAEALLEEARQFYEEGSYEDALRQIERVLLLDETNREALEYKEKATQRIQELEDLRRKRKEEQRRQIRQLNINRALESGRTNIERGRFSAAMDNFKTALELKPDNRDAKKGYTSSGITLIEEFINRENYLRARETIEKVLEVKPDFSEALSLKEEINTVLYEKAANLNRQALSLYAVGKLQEAIRTWEKALEMYPEHESARQNLDRARRELQE